MTCFGDDWGLVRPAEMRSSVLGRDRNGNTALLHYAARFPYAPEILEGLSKSGAGVNVRNDYGYTPLHLAAANNNNPEVVKILIQAGADLEARNTERETALILAVKNKIYQSVLSLIKAGAKVDVRNKNGNAPLGLAIPGRSPEIVNYQPAK